MAHEGKNKKGSHFFDLSSQPHFIHDMVFSFIRQLTTSYNINIFRRKRIYLLDHTNMKNNRHVSIDNTFDHNKSSTLMKLMVI